MSKNESNETSFNQICPKNRCVALYTAVCVEWFRNWVCARCLGLKAVATSHGDPMTLQEIPTGGGADLTWGRLRSCCRFHSLVLTTIAIGNDGVERREAGAAQASSTVWEDRNKGVRLVLGR